MKLRVPGARAPLYCRTSGSDIFVLWQALGKRHFEVGLPEPPRLVVDGGANVGYASVYLAERYPGARILAVEPDQENCALLRRNCSAYPNVELIEGALWTSNSDLTIENPADESWAFRVTEAPPTEKDLPAERSFKGLTITEILARSGERRIDLLKLDVEGAEERLFSPDHEGWLEGVENLMVETHGESRHAAVLAAAKKQVFNTSYSGEYVVLKRERGLKKTTRS